MSNGNSTQSLITVDMEIIGTIKSSGSVRIDGKLDGELICSGDAIIGKSAVIKGNLAVNSVSIEGSLNGNVAAKDKIEMKATARVNGDIKSKRLAVEDGVTFVGKSEVNPSGTPVGIPPAAKPEAVEEEKPAENRPGAFARR
ncbi:MAG TPA: cell shape determination protein CcmA [Verrucomicrobia bacterium]|nr:MAG: hypothetical protein A2X46_01355 [Lentisphaerae bacterium GWF2_57_35]HBA83161.1 cell shape determination protein CcmA [Verrucomicrobiota bacterium]